MPEEFEIFKTSVYDSQAVVMHSHQRLNMRAEIAVNLTQHMAIVAAQEDGEDSAGRRAFKLQTPEQVVKRACEIANGLMNEFEARGWLIEVPPYDDIKSIKRDR